jgi:hypothetical protein
MKTNAQQRAIHLHAIARWFARRRKTTIQKLLLDLKIKPPGRHPEDVFYHVSGRRTHAFVVAGQGEVWRALKQRSPDGSTHELIGNVFDDDPACGGYSP